MCVYLVNIFAPVLGAMYGTIMALHQGVMFTFFAVVLITLEGVLTECACEFCCM